MTLRASPLCGSSKMPPHLVFAALPLTPLGPPSLCSGVVSHLQCSARTGVRSKYSGCAILKTPSREVVVLLCYGEGCSLGRDWSLTLCVNDPSGCVALLLVPNAYAFGRTGVRSKYSGCTILKTPSRRLRVFSMVHPEGTA